MTPSTPASHFVDTYVRLFLVHAIFLPTEKRKFRKEGGEPIFQGGQFISRYLFQIFVRESEYYVQVQALYWSN